VPWIAILLCLAGAVSVLVLLARRSRRPDEPGSESDEDSGGGGNKRPERPSPSDSGGEPSWWPQFERDLADYVQRIEAVGRRPNQLTRNPR
jgi:hypothetical protein